MKTFARNDRGADTARSIAPDYVMQLARLLRVALMHQLDNEAAKKVTREFMVRVEGYFDELDIIALRLVGNHLYLNDEFVPLIGRALESALQLRRIFSQLMIRELTIVDRFDRKELLEFLEAFQGYVWQQDQTESLPGTAKFVASPAGPEESHENLSPSEIVTRAYMHLAALAQEALWRFTNGERVSIPKLRRSVHLLTDAALGQEPVLLALTQIPNPKGDPVLHSAAVAALSILMGFRLGLERRLLSAMVLSAVFHDLLAEAPVEAAPARISVRALVAAQRHAGLRTALHVGRFLRSVEALDRASIALECCMPASGGDDGVIPSMAARCIAVACAYDMLVHPPPPWIGVRSDQAMNMLSADVDAHFDPKAVALLRAVIGVFPVGSLVQLSTGQIGVVLATPGPADRPTVRVIREAGQAKANHIVELSREGPEVSIVRCLESEPVDGLHFLLA